MAGSISTIYETRVLNWIFNASAVARPTTWYVGLFTDGTGLAADQPSQEATTANCPGYARQPVTFGTTAGDSITNPASAPTFTATGDWSPVNYFGVFDALTGGNMIAWGDIPTKTLANTDQLKFDNNQITVTLD